MRSPIIALSIMAATVSPTLVAASSPQGNSITHPRVTEVETKNPSNPLQFLKRQLSASKLSKLQNFNDPLSLFEGLVGGAGAAASSASPTNGGGPLSNVPTQDLPTQDVPTQDLPTQDLPPQVAQPVDSTVGESPAGQVAEPAEPKGNDNPYQGGRADSTSSSKNSNDGKQGSRVHKQDKAELEQMALEN